MIPPEARTWALAAKIDAQRALAMADVLEETDDDARFLNYTKQLVTTAAALTHAAHRMLKALENGNAS